MVTAIVITLVVLYSINAIGNIYMIGKPRKPLTSGTAAVSVIVAVVLILAVLYLGSQAS